MIRLSRLIFRRICLLDLEEGDFHLKRERGVGASLKVVRLERFNPSS